jgi:hypothetical protein
MIAALQVPSPYVLGDGSLSNGMYQWQSLLCVC